MKYASKYQPTFIHDDKIDPGHGEIFQDYALKCPTVAFCFHPLTFVIPQLVNHNQ